VLDTVNPAGFSAGSIDAAQFKWLEGELQSRSSRYYDPAGKLVESDAKDRLVVVVSHHPLDRLNNPLPDPSGEARVLGPQLEELLHRFPNVIAYIAGHSHMNSITPKPDPERRGGSYWEVTSASPVALPMQGRLLEVIDNRDGSISLFTTIYDIAAPLAPDAAGDPTPADEINEEQLAAIARSVAASDPQRDPQAAGLAPSDRNAEMLLATPFDLAGVETPARHRPLPAAGVRRVSRRALLWGLVASRDGR
jgi:hypothetical protein